MQQHPLYGGEAYKAAETGPAQIQQPQVMPQQTTLEMQAPVLGYAGGYASFQNQGQTIIAVQQPNAQQPINRYDLTGINDWSSGICDCFSNCGLCVYACFCLECVVCDVIHSTGEHCCMALCCGAGAGPIVRATVRHQYRIKGTLANDLAVFYCCEDCLSWQQIYRELKAHGNLDPCCPVKC